MIPEFDLFDVIRLVRPVRRDGVSLPAGALGTIVEEAGQDAFLVEFAGADYVAATIHPDEMRLDE